MVASDAKNCCDAYDTGNPFVDGNFCMNDKYATENVKVVINKIQQYPFPH